MSARTSTPVALVTGGRRGIGRGIAYALAEAGFDVVINDIVRDELADESLAGVEARGRRTRFLAGDIADPHGHAELVSQAFDAFGTVGCLVNNAGISVDRRGDLLEVTTASFDRVLDVNLRGTFFLTQAVARRMLEEPCDGSAIPRSIIVIGSSSATVASVDRSEYCIAKAGLSMLTKLFAVRLASHGIAVFEIRPGIILTDMTAVAKEKYDVLIAGGVSPIARWGEPADVGRAAAALASGALPFDTGDVLNIDGGLHIARL